MARLTLLGFIRDQRRRPVPPVVSVDLTGKTVVVIGANTGLGFEASKHFARMSPGRLILGCRDSERGTAALSRKFNPVMIDITSCSKIHRIEGGDRLRWSRTLAY